LCQQLLGTVSVYVLPNRFRLTTGHSANATIAIFHWSFDILEKKRLISVLRCCRRNEALSLDGPARLPKSNKIVIAET
jgi:hypothetical protein